MNSFETMPSPAAEPEKGEEEISGLERKQGGGDLAPDFVQPDSPLGDGEVLPENSGIEDGDGALAEDEAGEGENEKVEDGEGGENGGDGEGGLESEGENKEGGSSGNPEIDAATEKRLPEILRRARRGLADLYDLLPHNKKPDRDEIIDLISHTELEDMLPGMRRILADAIRRDNLYEKKKAGFIEGGIKAISRYIHMEAIKAGGDDWLQARQEARNREGARVEAGVFDEGVESEVVAGARDVSGDDVEKSARLTELRGRVMSAYDNDDTGGASGSDSKLG